MPTWQLVTAWACIVALPAALIALTVYATHLRRRR